MINNHSAQPSRGGGSGNPGNDQFILSVVIDIPYGESFQGDVLNGNIHCRVECTFGILMENKDMLPSGAVPCYRHIIQAISVQIANCDSGAPHIVRRISNRGTQSKWNGCASPGSASVISSATTEREGSDQGKEDHEPR
jgi:hypothetical protein